MPLLMVFIDGMGLGTNNNSINPFISAEMPFIRSLLSGEPLLGETIKAGLVVPGVVIKHTDSSLNISGIPQSATGQTALFTGINGAEITGRHISGFPTKALRDILNHHSIFKVIHQSGRRAVFANTFSGEYFQATERGKWRHSVTTTAALAGGCRLLMVPNLIQGEAVYQDLTNQELREKGYALPLIEPEEAAANLVKVASKNDFTLFEYFQTDRCGHRQDFNLALILLNRLDRFWGTLVKFLDEYHLVLLVVSDHGNIEDLGVKTHTRNPVPTIAIGSDLFEFEGINSLLDIYPAVLRFLGINRPEATVQLTMDS